MHPPEKHQTCVREGPTRRFAHSLCISQSDRRSERKHGKDRYIRTDFSSLRKDRCHALWAATGSDAIALCWCSPAAASVRSSESSRTHLRPGRRKRLFSRKRSPPPDLGSRALSRWSLEQGDAETEPNQPNRKICGGRGVPGNFVGRGIVSTPQIPRVIGRRQDGIHPDPAS